MHRFRTALLAAAAIGAGIPAIASAQREGLRPDGEQRERPDRGPRGDDGQPRQGGGQTERPQAPPQPPQAQAPQQPPAPPAQAAPGRPDGRAVDRGDRRQGFGQPGQAGQPDPRGFAGRDDRRPGFDPRQGYDPRPDARQQPGFDPRRGDPRPGFAGNGYRPDEQRVGDRGRDGGRPDFRPGGPQGRIGQDWRSDRRYDWRGYRDQHRQIFRAGRYVPPRAYYRYGYRPFEIGIRLDPFFYARDYWIDDPYEYRLPPVWGSYRWVRYYDDVLLVDLSTGQVIDVIHQFFW